MAGKGSEWRPHSATKFADGYDRIDWGNRQRQQQKGKSFSVFVICVCGATYRINLKISADGKILTPPTICGKCQARLSI